MTIQVGEASLSHRETCPACGREFDYERSHAGFSNLGFMYCDQDETVMTWGSYNPRYTHVVSDKHPWMLSADEQQEVEAAVKPCPAGGRFAFGNPPLCPFCYKSVAFLVPGKEYFIVTGRRLDADLEDAWV